jgi:DNA repair protein RadA/Sms
VPVADAADGKAKTAYVCSECGAVALQWFGSCPRAAPRHADETCESGSQPRGARARAVPLRRVERGARAPSDRHRELDRALGGGLVAGQVTLLGGDPGIGKSTLLLQCLATLSEHEPSTSGEESADQSRCARGASRSTVKACACSPRPSSSASSRARGAAAARRGGRLDPDAVVRDAAVGARLGGAGARVRGAAHAPRQARRHALFIVGHVTKEGAIAGPRRAGTHRRHGALLRRRHALQLPLLRAVKNRFRRGE